MASDQSLSLVGIPLAITPLVAGATPFVFDHLAPTPSCYHTICSLPEVFYHSLAIITSVSTQPRYHPPPRPLPHAQAAGLPCTLLITGDTLDSTPPHSSTPGENTFEGRNVITEVCSLPYYIAGFSSEKSGATRCQEIDSAVGKPTTFATIASTPP